MSLRYEGAAHVLAALPLYRYVWFDFHHECRKLQWHNLSKLINQLEADMGAVGFFSADGQGKVLRKQVQTLLCSALLCSHWHVHVPQHAALDCCAPHSRLILTHRAYAIHARTRPAPVHSLALPLLCMPSSPPHVPLFPTVDGGHAHQLHGQPGSHQRSAVPLREAGAPHGGGSAGKRQWLLVLLMLLMLAPRAVAIADAAVPVLPCSTSAAVAAAGVQWAVRAGLPF